MKTKSLRYIVTGPGIVEAPSYDAPGPALSRAVTAANRAACRKVESTYYARDSITGDIIGYSECDALGVVTTRRNA